MVMTVVVVVVVMVAAVRAWLVLSDHNSFPFNCLHSSLRRRRDSIAVDCVKSRMFEY